MYEVSDGQYSSTATVTVTVSPVNDAPEFTTTEATRSAVSSAQPGTAVGATVTATDIDGDTLTYSLEGPDAASFDIDEFDGQILVGSAALQVQTYTVLVVATDSASPPGKATIEVTIDVSATPVTPPVVIGGGFAGGGGGGPSGPMPSEEDFEWTVTRDIEDLDGGHDTPSGLWSDGTTLWLAENGDGADDAIYAYDLESGERVEDREFELNERNRAPRGVWSDRTTLWIADSGQERLFAYDLGRVNASPVRTSSSPTATPTRAASGLTGWPSGSRDHGEKRLFAYRLPSTEAPVAEDADAIPLERVRDEEFSNMVLSPASNNSPRGIWSDGDVMYVADESDNKVYSYNMPDAINARLASLTLSGVDFGQFDPGRTEYEGTVSEGVTETVVTAEALQRRTDVDIDPPDADGDEANGYQVALKGLGEITVTVTSPDGSRERVYRVTIEIPAEEVELTAPWTSLVWPGADGIAIADALREGGIADRVVVVYHWDEATRSWLAFFPGIEDVPALNTLTTLGQGRTYWIGVTEPVAWTVGNGGAALAAANRSP